MKTLSVAFCILIAANLAATEAQSHRGQRTEDRGRPTLRIDPDEVLSEYQLLSSLDLGSRKEYYRYLPMRMKSELWTMHLHTFLTSHTELTADQKGVIYYGIGLLSSGLLEDAELQKGTEGQLLAQIKSHFTPTTAEMIFRQLGSHETILSGSHLTPTLGGVVRAMMVDCDCSVESNWCDWISNPTPYCRSVQCLPHIDGCGTFWNHACDGLCSP